MLFLQVIFLVWRLDDKVRGSGLKSCSIGYVLVVLVLVNVVAVDGFR